MIFKGTSKLGVGEISKKIESYGGDVNAFTSFDETACYATVSNDFVPQVLDIFSNVCTMQHLMVKNYPKSLKLS